MEPPMPWSLPRGAAGGQSCDSSCRSPQCCFTPPAEPGVPESPWGDERLALDAATPGQRAPSRSRPLPQGPGLPGHPPAPPPSPPLLIILFLNQGIRINTSLLMLR